LASFLFLASNCSVFETLGFEFRKLEEGSEEESESESEEAGEDKLEAGGASRSWVEVVEVVRKWVNLEGGLPLDLLPRGDIVVVLLGVVISWGCGNIFEG